MSDDTKSPKNASSESSSLAPSRLHRSGLPTRASARLLRKQIFEAEHPESFVRRLPAQALHFITVTDGIASSSELMLIASAEQTRLILDFDCWTGDEFNEDRFWEWLELPDAEEQQDGLQLLQRLIRGVDLKLVATLVSNYLLCVQNEEPTDAPPDKGFYSPDKGHTWIRVQTGSEHRDFLFNRLLAMLFETNADIFYQLISAPGVATPSMLVEEAFQERSKRLSGEGIPESDYAHEVCSPSHPADVLKGLNTSAPKAVVEDIIPISPLVHQTGKIEPLHSLIEGVSDLEQLESELTLIANAAVVRFGVDFGDSESLLLLLAQVKGTVNIGLEALLEKSGQQASELYDQLGLQRFFSAGLHELLEFRRQAMSLLPSEPGEGPLGELRASISRPFPALPKVIQGSPEDWTEKEELSSVDFEPVAVNHSKTLESALAKLRKILAEENPNP